MRNFLKNAFLVLVSVVLCTAAAEAMVRWLDAGEGDAAAAHLDAIPRSAGVARDWYFSDPPPLPNRGPVSAEWLELVRRVEQSGVTAGTRRADMFKAWNTAFVGDPCKHPYLRDAPGQLFVYDPPDGNPRPTYRFLPNATTPIGLVTNQYGFRGPPVPFARSPNTVRIVFVGASTTVSSHHLAYSYPEFIGHWLNLWAQAKKLDVRFEVLNAGREGIASPDIAAIVRTEVVPLRPDLVVYYEGANQFDLGTVVPNKPAAQPVRPAEVKPDWLAQHSALVRRLRALLGSTELPTGGGEWPKPKYALVWPTGVDERAPDITRADLPVNLPVILGDLDRIRAALAGIDSELVLSSYMWLVRDGMELNPIRHRPILEYLNVGYFPYRYRDMARLAAFQNRVFARYAAVHGLGFVDVAGVMPFDPDLFVDAIHGTQAGVRLRGWIAFQQLLPIIEQHLANGTWPKKVLPAAGTPPAFTPRSISFDCK